MAAVGLLVLSGLLDVACGIVASRRLRGRVGAWWLVMQPFYAMLGTAAAYKALSELATRPFYWDKTSHGGVVVQGSPVSTVAGKSIARVGDKAHKLAARLRPWTGDKQAVEIDIALAQGQLQGWIDTQKGRALVVKPGSFNGKDLLLGWIQHLCLSLSGAPGDTLLRAALRADGVGVNRDEVALPRGQTDISPKEVFIGVKYSG